LNSRDPRHHLRELLSIREKEEKGDTLEENTQVKEGPTPQEHTTVSPDLTKVVNKDHSKAASKDHTTGNPDSTPPDHTMDNPVLLMSAGTTTGETNHHLRLTAKLLNLRLNSITPIDWVSI